MARSVLPPLEPGFVTVGEQSLYHRSARPAGSNGQSLVHIHGFGISGTYLEPTAALLAGEFNSFVPDLPGFGKTRGPMRNLTISGLAETVFEYCSEVGVERATFIGNSLGCALIVELATSHPELVERAVLVGPAGGPNNQPLPRAVAQLAKDMPREPASMARVALPDYLRFGPIRGVSLFRAMTRFPTIERLHEMDVPTLIILGERDPLVDRARLAEAFASTADLTAVSIPGAHALNYSHPEDVAKLVSMYLADQSLEDCVAGLEVLVERHGPRD